MSNLSSNVKLTGSLTTALGSKASISTEKKSEASLTGQALKGDNGITPNIQIGTVTTLEAGEDATVTREGTNENPIFNFGIPRGHSLDVTEIELLKNINRIYKTTEERDNETDVKNGIICYVEEDGVYYSRKKDEWVIFQSGSGGSSAIGSLTSTLDKQSISISVGQLLDVDLFFSTPNAGKGTLYVTTNGKELLKQSINMGSNNITLNLTKGTHKLELYVIDKAGIYTNIVLITVQCGGLDISTVFNMGKDYTVGSFITFPYTIETVSKQPITTYFKIGSNEYETTSYEGYNVYVFPVLGAGKYNIEIYSVSGNLESNKIKFTLVILNSDSLYVSSLFDKKEAEEGDQLIIDYRISMSGVKEFNVEYYVDDKLYKKGKGYNGSNAFPISDLKVGSRKITIKVFTLDKKHMSEIDINIKITESSYQLQKPIEQGLLAWFDAYGLSNQDLDRGIWKDKSGNNRVGTLYNFNYSSNGWLNNGLKMNGSAYAKLDVQPFLSNAETGITIDIEFTTEDVGNENARVLDCVTRLASGLGCYIDTSEALIKSNANTVKSPFAQNEKTRVTYVIDRLNKLIKIYINAVLCEAAFLTDMGIGNEEILEDFKHSECIYLNSTKGEFNFGDCTVYSVRVYGRNLSSEEVLQNYIADIKDKALQKEKYDFNHHNTIPTMYFYGDTKAITKDIQVPLRIKYISTDDREFGASFDLENCLVQWQGTSSLQYAVKNYKIRLKDENGKKFKRPLRENMIPEDKFVLKADYMESSHASNTGLAKIVNRYLYEEKLPPQQVDEKVVSAIDGFPIKLFINDQLMGVFNFNLDKGNDDSFGFDKKNPNCISYEISANTDTTAGAFNKWDGIPTKDIPDELTYLQKDFELRFPDDKEFPEYGYMDQLKRVVDWVSDADDTKFRNEFEQYFNKEYTLKYYLFVLVMGMVDNLGKNMMLNTWDGKIWYPCFYDLDTGLGLDNSGYIKFDVDIEMEAGTYNTSGSNLWTKVGRVFEKELKDTYKKMRSTIFKEENIFKVLIDEQIDQIPELLYNDDSQKKYLNFGKSYIHMLHGNRREHMRKWVTERLLYLDSKLGYEENTKESITVRANKKGKVYFDIKTYSPIYIKVRWRNGEEETQKVNRNEIKRFSYDLPTATDQEIFIYAAKHLKEIGDISHMTPTSLSLTNASRLTKLECRDNKNLQALGMGGVVDGVSYNLKNLQLLDLTGCSKLGTVSGNNGLDVSKCDNLKTLKVQGTSLQNITFNPLGGNLEEIYLPHSITSLYLANQYSLRKIEFPSYADHLYHYKTYSQGSKITKLTINNCPNLNNFGLPDDSLNLNNVVNYAGVTLYNQDSNFAITKEEYKQAFKLGCFGCLEKVSITNSLINLKYFAINYSANLSNVEFNNMPNLQGLILLGNKTYNNNNESIEGIPSFENITVNNCEKFDTLILQKAGVNNDFAYRFKENFTWDLSNLQLKKFICNISLENLKKIILPDTIEEFSHSNTKIVNNKNTVNGSRIGYTKEMSPLETIVIAGQHNDDFKGIDLNNIELKNVNLNGLTQRVEIIKNVNCKAIDINPRLVSEHVSEQPLENIQINLNEFKGNSFYGTFKNTDMSKVQITLNNNITTQNMDYSEMFNNAKNVTWEKIQWLKKLPKGKIYKTFTHCDADRLDIGNMIGETTVDMQYCFQNMPKVTEIDLTGINTNNVNNFEGCFQNSTKLERLIGAENLIKEKCDNIKYMFNNTRKLKFSFPNNKPNWKLRAGKFQDTQCWLESCGRDVVLEENETNILDLREFGILSGNYYNGFCNEQYMGFTHFYGDGWDYTGTGTTSHDGKPNYSYCPNLVELHLTNCKFESAEAGIVYDNPNLVTLNLEGTDASKMRLRNTRMNFAKNPKLEHVTFLQNMKYPIDFSASTLLTEKSLLSILNGLADLKGSSPQAAKLGKANLDKLSESQKQIAIKKNWTLTE